MRLVGPTVVLPVPTGAGVPDWNTKLYAKGENWRLSYKLTLPRVADSRNIVRHITHSATWSLTTVLHSKDIRKSGLSEPTKPGHPAGRPY